MIALKLFAPGQPANRWPHCQMPDDARCTLREYYETRIRNERQSSLAHRTLTDDREALVAWERAGSSLAKDWSVDSFQRVRWRLHEGPERISNPPIGLLVDDDLRHWQQVLIADGLSPVTINKWYRYLNTFLLHAGPRDRTNRGGAGVLLQTPTVKRLPEPKVPRFIPTVDEVDAVFRAIPQLVAIDNWWPVARWQALLVLVTSLGFRPGDLTRVSWTGFEPDTSDLLFQPRKTKKAYGLPMRWPVRPEVLAYLQAGRATSGRNKHRLLPSLSSPNYFGPLWRQLIELAGCSHPSEPNAAGQRSELFSLYSLRRFANVRLNEHHDGAGEYLLGHAFKQDRTNRVSYTDFLRFPKHVVEAVKTVPLPPSFVECLPSPVR